ncbi:MAG: response regulator [Verrucomicrobiae bacterium]|nr:response regulator [Verrucomicrobiae bacterium]
MSAIQTLSSPPVTTSSERPTLLIVDDEAGPRESLRIVFKDRYRCVLATSGTEGIAYARQNPVDLAILDIKMPDISGVDVLRELKQLDPDIECIMLTGYETLDTARAALRLGASDYLNKPFDVYAIREVVERCWNRRQKKKQQVITIESLRKMNDELTHELAQSQRAVTAGVISAGVVHELNNPLSIIAGYTQMLARDLQALETGQPIPPQTVQQRLNSIQREIARCKEIAKRFLNFSRTRYSDPDWVEAGKLVEDAAALVKAHPANRGLEISWHAGSPSLRCRAHPAELLQVLLNLGVNAIQAMEGRGKLHFEAERVEPGPAEPAFRASGYHANQTFVRFSVQDTGCGISPENLAKIFQPYFTTKQQGTGLGLAIVCELIKQYNGAIDVHSTVGQGTTFEVYIPIGA